MSRLIQIIEKPQFVIFKDKGKWTCGATEVINVFEDDEHVIRCIPAFGVYDVNHDTADELLAASKRDDRLHICEGMHDKLFNELIETELADNKGCYFDALTEVLRYMHMGKFHLFQEYKDRLTELKKAIDKVLEQ